ncbi:MAG TPA: hypothetical protein VMV81_13005 [Phycisphaerae bacterium]|nr:hypothetical protein [Phycisphaerae bacterium]
MNTAGHTSNHNAALRGRWRLDGRWQCDCGGGMFSSSAGLYVGSHASTVSRCKRCQVLRPLRSVPVSDNPVNLTDTEKAGRLLISDYIDRRIDFDHLRSGLQDLGLGEDEIAEVVNAATMHRVMDATDQ